MELTIEEALIEKFKTYSTRHKVILDMFLNDNTRIMSKESIIEYNDLLKRLDLFDQLSENLYDIINLQKESLDKSVAILKTAIHIYSLKFGNELVVPEGFIEFGIDLKIKVDVIPEPGKITVKVEKHE